MKLVSKKEKPTYEQIDKENLKLKQMLLTAKKFIDEHGRTTNRGLSNEEMHERFASRIASIEFERRKEHIAVIVSGIYPEEEVLDRIDDFSKSGLHYEAIHNIVKPLKANKRTKQEQK